MHDIGTGQTWKHKATSIQYKVVVYRWLPTGRIVSIMALWDGGISDVSEADLLSNYELVLAEVS